MLQTSLAQTSPTIFVVDDDASVRRALGRLIRSAGMAVEVFASAQEFLDAERPPGPGCLVLDLRMPGMTGLALQQQMIDRLQDLPIVIMTGHADEEMRRKTLELGASAVLLKPFEDDELLGAIDKALR